MRLVTFFALIASALAAAAASAGPHDPTGVHPSFGDEEDQMVVTWSTAKSTDADVRYSPSDPESSTPYGPVVMGSIMIATMSVFIGVTAANFQSIA